MERTELALAARLQTIRHRCILHAFLSFSFVTDVQLACVQTLARKATLAVIQRDVLLYAIVSLFFFLSVWFVLHDSTCSAPLRYSCCLGQYHIVL